MKILPLISLILIVLSAICTIIGFSTYWFYTSVNIEGEMELKTYYKYNKVKIIVDGVAATSGYSSLEQSFSHQLKFFKAALAMDILAFVNLFFAAIPMGIYAFKDLSVSHQSKLKNSLNAATVFLIIATFVVLGVPKARRQDCESNLENESTSFSSEEVSNICDNDYYHKFHGEFEAGNSKIQFGPYTAWIAIVIGLGLSFFNNIFVYCGGVFKQS
ncbi:hypothetical protein RB653_003542 [Dictyostelium firmibasis]|uniref:Uncharacterized protein n=1 Tax=Dictyostelium firmibasis TaxID=79012 RepID=A0AAN7YX34_9MYCE